MQDQEKIEVLEKRVKELEQQLGAEKAVGSSLRRSLEFEKRVQQSALQDAAQLREHVARLRYIDRCPRIAVDISPAHLLSLPEKDRNRELRFAVYQAFQMLLRKASGEEILREFLINEQR
jgi:uncharacterized protein (DUF2344 family)